LIQMKWQERLILDPRQILAIDVEQLWLNTREARFGF
jgi:hypothetical protein